MSICEKVQAQNFLQRFYAAFNRGFNATINRYGKSLGFLYKNKWITAVILILAVVGIWWSASTTPTGFVPNEDRGIVFANVELPAGSSLDKTNQITGELYNKIKDLPGVDGLNMVDGFSLLNGQGSNYALGFIKLKDWSEREEDSLSAEAITGKLFGIAATIPDANIIFFSPPSIPGFSASSGVEVNLLDRSGGSFKDLDQANQEFIQNICASFQNAVAETLINKCKRALSVHNLSRLVVGGGVAANQYLRDRLEVELKGIDLFFPKLERCTDNGAMVALTGFYRLKKSKSETSINIKPRWNLSEI